MKSHRTEADSMGEVQVPADALYGAQTARAVDHFPISGLRFPRAFIRALGLIKQHAARTNAALGLLPEAMSQAIQQAAQEVLEGQLDAHFVVDIFQCGSGTSINMNANEVIAHRASEILGGERGVPLVHPLDHVNRGQSSNDVIPTAIHIAALETIEFQLRPALSELHAALLQKAQDWQPILKLGRTHLQDAASIRLGQEFSGYAAQVDHALRRLQDIRPRLSELALGGTAVGTGLNTDVDFARRTIAALARAAGLGLCETPNHFESQAAQDAAVEASGVLKSVAVSLAKIANDIRWLSSGPRGGLGELKLPPTLPGSSIMPGKANPVMCEIVIQVGAQVIGNDAVIAFGGMSGNFELNTMLPVIAYNLLQSIGLLANASRVFARRCVVGLEPDIARCAANLNHHPILCTALTPVIGYDLAPRIAGLAQESGRPLHEVAREMSGVLAKDDLDGLLDPAKLTEPGLPFPPHPQGLPGPRQPPATTAEIPLA